MKIPSPDRFLTSRATVATKNVPAAKPRKSMDHKYEVGGRGVVHFLRIYCQYGKILMGL